MTLFIIFIASYLIGSVPTAYLLVKLKAGYDIRKKGSTNVGAMNAYEVTGSKPLAVAVGVLDALKGFIVPFVLLQLSYPFWIQAIALLITIIGHNYPVWLKFHGGRGLAAAAGGLFAIGLSYIIVWCVVWIISFKLTRDILKANIISIVFAPVLLILVPHGLIEMVMIQKCVLIGEYRVFSVALSIIHLLSHLQPLKEIIKNLKSSYWTEL